MSVPTLKPSSPSLTVALCGSQGCAEALHQFVAQLPPDSGMAFIVVVHPSQVSAHELEALMSGLTRLPVIVASDGTALMPDQIHFTSPDHVVSFSDECLRLRTPEKPVTWRTTIDGFLRVFADALGSQAVAIILSGSDGDGAMGIQRIKERGGLTIAQDPNEAPVPDMPRAAIGTETVDWVLKVAEMPSRLLEYKNRGTSISLLREVEPAPPIPVVALDEFESTLTDILAFVKTRTGCDFSYYKRATIARRLSRRMHVIGFDTLPDYLAHLRTHAGEANALLHDLLIPVTNFFRDRDCFDALARVIPELFRGKGAADTVRVWVPACATGEEAYSIAILLCEHARTLEAPPQIQVFATDLDEAVVRQARDGVYPATITADVTDERLLRYFVQQSNAFQVRRELRELVLFASHDLLTHSPFSRLDLVSCRNLLIYFDREAQKRALDIFHFALRPGGRLFLGSTESIEEEHSLFGVTDKKHRLYVRQAARRQSLPLSMDSARVSRATGWEEQAWERPALPRRSNAENREGVSAGLHPASGISASELHYRFIEHLSPPSVLVDANFDIVHVSESAPRFLRYTAGSPSRSILKTVRPSLRVDLRAALHSAALMRESTSALDVAFDDDNKHESVDIVVHPAEEVAPHHLLVVFKSKSRTGEAEEQTFRSAEADAVTSRLEQALETTRLQLRDTIENSEAAAEELKASNEELQAMNEELRSATEELETGREELSSINEELTAVNRELTLKVEQLAHANSDLQNLISATAIATVFLDRNLRITRYTPSAVDLFHLIPTDIGRPLTDITHRFDYAEMAADAGQALTLLTPSQREVQAGDQWFLARAVPYRTVDDRIAGVVFTFVDITARKEAEEEIRRSEALYRAIGESLDFGVWVCAPDGRNIYASESFLKMVGLTQDQCSNFGWGEILHPDDAENTITAWKRCVAEGGRWSVKHRFRGVDGQWHPILARGVPVRDSAGKIMCWAGINLDISDQERAEKEARESEARFRSMANAINQLAWIARPDGHIFWFNQRWYEYTGRTPEEMDGWGWQQVHDPKCLPAVMERWAECIATGTPLDMTFPLRGADGNFRQFLTRVIPLKDDNGQVTTWFGTNTDVEEITRAEMAIRTSKERLHLATDAAGLGIWIWQPDRNAIVWENDWLLKTLAIEYNQAEGAACFSDEIIHRDDQEAFAKALAETARTENRFEFKGRIRVDDSQWRWVEFSGKMVRIHPETPLALIGTSQDVTLREQAAASLRQNASLFATLIEQAPMGTYVVDSNFCLKQVNPEAQSVFRTISPLIGRDFEEVLTLLWGPEMGRELANIFRHTLETGERYRSERFSATRYDLGEEETYEWETQRVTLPNGKHGVVCYFHEVTQRHNFETALRQAKQAAEEANQAKDRFLAVLSHELRTPLTPVLMAATSLEQDADLRDDVREEMGMIRRNVALETRLIDDLLDVSRITNGKVELAITNVDLNDAIRTVCNTCQQQFHEKHLRLELVLDEDAGGVPADSARLHQILANLVQNAIKFTSAHGMIRITSWRIDTQCCEVRVQDSGIGIPPEMLGRIFNAFDQGDVNRTRKFGGLGLGLAISRALVELHGGKIRVESDGLGKGATFIVSLPGKPISVSEPSAVIHSAPEARTQKTCVLLVEDHPDTARTLARLLRRAGFMVIFECSVKSAVAIAAREPIDVVVTDLGLPDGDGYQLLHRVQAIRQVPCIAMSGYGTQKDLRRSAEEGFLQHLVKPIDIDELIAAIRKAAAAADPPSKKA